MLASTEIRRINVTMGMTERTVGVLSIFTFEGEASDEDIDSLVACLDDRLDRKSAYVVLVEATRTRGMSARQARKLADFTKRREADLRAFCRGIAFVIPSLFVRGILRGIFALQAPPYPSTIVENTAQALEWLRPRAPATLPPRI